VLGNRIPVARPLVGESEDADYSGSESSARD